MKQQKLIDLELAVAGVLNDTLIYLHARNQYPSELVTTMAQRSGINMPMQQHYQQPIRPHNNPWNMQGGPFPQPVQPQQHPWPPQDEPVPQQRPPHVNEFTWNELLTANRNVRQQRSGNQTSAGTERDVPVDLNVLLSRLHVNLKLANSIVEVELNALPDEKYKSTLDDIKERLDALESVNAPIADNGDDVEPDTDYEVNPRSRPFPKTVSVNIAATAHLLVQKYGPVNTPHADMYYLFSSLSELFSKATDDTAVAVSSQLYSRFFINGCIYAYPGTSQNVCILPVGTLTYMLVYNADYLEIDALYVSSVNLNGNYTLAKVKHNFAAYDDILNSVQTQHDTDTLREPMQRELYTSEVEACDFPNILNIEGMRERIVAMRKGIPLITVPRKALAPVLQKIGAVNWHDPDTEVELDDDEYALTTTSDAVYSLPDHIRLVVVRGAGKSILMAYHNVTYVIHDLYLLTVNPDGGSVVRTSDPKSDLLFVLSLSEQE